MLVPNESLAATPDVVTLMAERFGAGSGASALSTSLNLSTAVPTFVLLLKSTNNPSAYPPPSSAAPIVPDPPPPPPPVDAIVIEPLALLVTVTLSPAKEAVDFISFFIHYNGGTNTDKNNYKIYVSKNGGFAFGSVGI